MDRGPLQEVDVHEGIESTLTILKHKLKYGVEVIGDGDLPHICATVESQPSMDKSD